MEPYDGELALASSDIRQTISRPLTINLGNQIFGYLSHFFFIFLFAILSRDFRRASVRMWYVYSMVP